jgi:hypothetical protein
VEPIKEENKADFIREVKKYQNTLDSLINHVHLDYDTIQM